MMKAKVTTCHFHRYRFGTSVTGPKANTPGRDFVGVLHELDPYKGTQAFQAALARTELYLSNYWTNRYQLKGSIFVEPKMKLILDKITDFSSFQGKTFREFVFFINDRVESDFVVIELKQGENLIGFVMADASTTAGADLQRTFMNYGQGGFLK
jgi:hypothetical protein